MGGVAQVIECKAKFHQKTNKQHWVSIECRPHQRQETELTPLRNSLTV
jgi:hypothetical protein